MDSVVIAMENSFTCKKLLKLHGNIQKYPKYAKIIHKMGVFHTIYKILSIFGKRFQDAGLHDLCIESEGSVNSILEDEALIRQAWQEFIP